MIIPDKICKLIEIILHILPTSKTKILFTSFHGQYNDNPKYISQEIHKQIPKMEIYWVLSKKSKMNDIPKYINVLHYNTFKYCWMKNRVRVIVENGAGEYLIADSTRYLFLKKYLKNNKQYDFSTWHGNPIKHIGAQMPGNEFWNEKTLFTTSNLLIAGSLLVKGIFCKAFLGKMPIKLLGTPRTDILFINNPKLKDFIKKKLGLPSGKKIILYAPTYRYSTQNSGIKQMSMFDFNKLFSTLSKKFGGEWVFVFRVHNMVLLDIPVEQLIKDYSGSVINGNTYDDMAEYLYVADALISDYSGCVFDIALTDKPCFLFAHDRKEYETKERGLYFQIEKFPYTFAETFEELIDNIASFDIDISNEKRKRFLDYIGNIEDGNASKRAVEWIVEKVLLQSKN